MQRRPPALTRSDWLRAVPKRSCTHCGRPCAAHCSGVRRAPSGIPHGVLTCAPRLPSKSCSSCAASPAVAASPSARRTTWPGKARAVRTTRQRVSASPTAAAASISASLVAIGVRGERPQVPPAAPALPRVLVLVRVLLVAVATPLPSLPPPPRAGGRPRRRVVGRAPSEGSSQAPPARRGRSAGRRRRTTHTTRPGGGL